MKKTVYFLFIALIFVTLNSCKDDPEPQPAPTISSITPTSGKVDTEVTIIGTGFDETASLNTVNFNGVAASIVSSLATQIVAKVPLNAGSGRVTVTTSSGTAEWPVFTYLSPPTITSIDPPSGTFNTVVTIVGTNFASAISENTVKVNGVAAVVTSATATQLVITVPNGAGTGKVSVTTSIGTVEGPVFTYLNIPTITSADPLTGPFGTSVTIIGTNFSATPANNTVKINGNVAAVTSASETQLVVTVPLGAGTGKISVATSDGIVEGPEFIYLLSTVVSTFAGDGTPGFLDGTGLNARFSQPSGLIVDAQDNLLVADRNNNRIRKITPEGVVTTIAGTGEQASVDGNGVLAKVHRPTGIFVAQGIIYFTEGTAAKVRMIALNGDVTTIAGSGNTGYVEGAAATAEFRFPTGIVKDSQGNLFIADFSNNVVRKISSGVVSTFAGDGTSNYSDGTGLAAQFNATWGITIDPQDNLYVSDFFNNRIRKITPLAVVTTLAGGDVGFLDGPASTAKFDLPYGVALDKDKNIFISDGTNGSIRKLSTDGNVTTIAGNGTRGTIINGVGTATRFSRVFGIAVNSKGEIFVSDVDNAVIRKIAFQ